MNLPRQPKMPRLLGVLLCYNDADILGDVIEHMRANHHDLVVWDHGSEDDTPRVLAKYSKQLLEHRLIPRSFDFYGLYQAMSQYLIQNYVARYDWISWPDQDEILEGPRRDRPYHEYLSDVFDSPYNWIQFNNYNYWLMDGDDATIVSPTKRIRHYSLFPDCAPRIRSWRASATNIRLFNHNPLAGERNPAMFNLRHYSARTPEQIHKRIFKDRANLQRAGMNYHYNNMKTNIQSIRFTPEQFHYDDGVGDLDATPRFNWRQLYGTGPQP